MNESLTVAELFTVVCDSIPHHNLFRELWSGRAVRIEELPRRLCPKCGRRLPVDRVGGSPGPPGAWTYTEAETTLLCFVCGYDRKRAVAMTLDDLDAGARRIVDRLATCEWAHWQELFVAEMRCPDPGVRAEAVGETFLLFGGSLATLHPHRERSDALLALASSSAVHWPHRA